MNIPLSLQLSPVDEKSPHSRNQVKVFRGTLSFSGYLLQLWGWSGIYEEKSQGYDHILICHVDSSSDCRRFVGSYNWKRLSVMRTSEKLGG